MSDHIKVKISVIRGRYGRSLCIGSEDGSIDWRLVGPKLDGNNVTECSFVVEASELRRRVTAICRRRLVSEAKALVAAREATP